METDKKRKELPTEIRTGPPDKEREWPPGEEEDTSTVGSVHEASHTEGSRGAAISTDGQIPTSVATLSPAEETYEKTKSRSDMMGELYEIKMAALLFLRLKNSETIPTFRLASNVEGAGALDDIAVTYSTTDDPTDASHTDGSRGAAISTDGRRRTSVATLSPAEETYEKTKSRSNMMGELYEIKMAALLFLRLKNSETIPTFRLASNVEGAGALDDIVVTYSTTDDPTEASHTDGSRGAAISTDGRRRTSVVTSSPAEETYEKTKSRSDMMGELYEIKMAALLFLRLNEQRDHLRLPTRFQC